MTFVPWTWLGRRPVFIRPSLRIGPPLRMWAAVASSWADVVQDDSLVLVRDRKLIGANAGCGVEVYQRAGFAVKLIDAAVERSAEDPDWSPNHGEPGAEPKADGFDSP